MHAYMQQHMKAAGQHAALPMIKGTSHWTCLDSITETMEGCGTLRGGVYREGLLVSDLHHVIHNIKVDGSWDGILANALTLQPHHTPLFTHKTMPTIQHNQFMSSQRHAMLQILVHHAQEIIKTQLSCLLKGAMQATHIQSLSMTKGEVRTW